MNGPGSRSQCRHARWKIVRMVDGAEMPGTEVAGRILDANDYMTLATADGDGSPWATPVWFAARGRDEFIWVSRPGARHSRNIAARPAVAIVIYDSTVPVGGAAAVYVEAVAGEVDAADRADALAVFSGRSEARGLEAWRETDVTEPAQHRLYRARASHVYILGDHDQRVPVP
jgi:nitroimidazol reductase NimA-like FMN-containing flavoprotein (pyridoxamine 5'-phosphate oxidase superfamily)